MPLDILVERKDTNGFVITPIGVIDADTYPKFEEAVRKSLTPTTKVIVLDLAKLQYINSMGLSVLVKSEKILQNSGGSLVVINLPSQIKKVIDVIAALPAMNIFKSLEEADAYLLKIQKDEIENPSL